MRTYSEPEIADILARAAERQAEASRTSARTGLTLDEIVRLGADAGLDAGALRAAAAEVDGAGQTLRRQAMHTPTQVVVERWLDGPLTPEGWEDTVIALRETAGPDANAAAGTLAMVGSVPVMMGQATPEQQQIGRAFEWTHTSGLGLRTTVLASPRGDRTRLRLTQTVGMAGPAAEGVAYGSLVGVLVGLVALFSAIAAGMSVGLVALIAAAAFGLTTAVAIPATTALDRRWRARKLRDLGVLADRIAPVLIPPATADVAGAPVAEALPLASPAPSHRIGAGILDADESAEPDGPTVAGGRARTRS